MRYENAQSQRRRAARAARSNKARELTGQPRFSNFVKSSSPHSGCSRCCTIKAKFRMLWDARDAKRNRVRKLSGVIAGEENPWGPRFAPCVVIADKLRSHHNPTSCFVGGFQQSRTRGYVP